MTVGRSLIAALAGLGVMTATVTAAAEPRDLIGARRTGREQPSRPGLRPGPHRRRGSVLVERRRPRVHQPVRLGRPVRHDRPPAQFPNATPDAGRAARRTTAARSSPAPWRSASWPPPRPPRSTTTTIATGTTIAGRPTPRPGAWTAILAARACYERGRGYSPSWTSHEFNYRY